jgi:copper chaperone CopZ
MKTKMLTFSFVMVLVGMSAFAQQVKTEKFEVYGNCGMCKARIEKAATSVDGVSKADWNEPSKVLAVTFDPKKTDVKKVNVAIAKVGHDTQTVKADDNAYDALPSCCKFERKIYDKK